MRRIALLPLTFSLLFPGSALTMPACTVFSQQAQGLNGLPIKLKIYPGHDVTIDFLQTGEVVKDAVIGDPSRLAYGSLVGTLCPRLGNLKVENCNSTGARVIYIRRIRQIDFPQLLPSADGSTELKLIVEGKGEIKQYQIGLVPMSSGKPSGCTNLVIKPDSEKFSPILPSIPVRESRSIPNRLPTRTRNQNPPQRTLVQNRSLVQGQQSNVSLLRQSSSSTETTATVRLPTPTPLKKTPEQLLPVPVLPLTSTEQTAPPSPQVKNPPKPPLQLLGSDSSPRNLRTQQVITSPDLSSDKVTSNRLRVAATLPSVNQPVQATNKQQPNRSSRRVVRTSTATSSSTEISQAIDDANAVAFGLRVAGQHNQINPRTTMYKKVQTAIRLLRQGKSREEAARRSGLNVSTLNQLIKWGQSRP